MSLANVGPKKKSWWWAPVPAPPILAEGIDRRRDERELDLDDTRSSFRRRYDDSPPPAPKVQVPFGVVITIAIYLVGQLIGGVWWAATQQSNLQHEIADRAREESRLWDSMQTYRAEVQALRVELARLSNSKKRNLQDQEED